MRGRRSDGGLGRLLSRSQVLLVQRIGRASCTPVVVSPTYIATTT